MNLGTGRGYSVREVIETAERVLGKPVPHVVGPRRAGDPAQLVADPSRAKQRLGWEPQRSDLETIVEDALRSRLPSIVS
jgi:UDP-glucose 4-epimerase